MALHLLASSFTVPDADLRWGDVFLRAERARLGLGRRSDRMTAAVISALDRLENRPDDAPLIFGSMLGAQGRITALQYDLLDFPEDQIGPVSFSCSVHNAVPGLFQQKDRRELHRNEAESLHGEVGEGGAFLRQDHERA